MAKVTAEHPAQSGTANDVTTRRDFLDLVAWSTLAIAAGTIAWPLIDQMNPSADVLALATTDVDIAAIPEGQAITVTWQGKPVFIRHRTPAEIAEAEQVPLTELRDPQPDGARVIEPQWLIVVGICTHLGCVPVGNKPTESRGDYGGWFCPCHGSHYDTAGRIRRGPAPTNLLVPQYAFTGEAAIRIG